MPKLLQPIKARTIPLRDNGRKPCGLDRNNDFSNIKLNSAIEYWKKKEKKILKKGCFNVFERDWILGK